MELICMLKIDGLHWILKNLHSIQFEKYCFRISLELDHVSCLGYLHQGKYFK